MALAHTHDIWAPTSNLMARSPPQPGRFNAKTPGLKSSNVRRCVRSMEISLCRKLLSAAEPRLGLSMRAAGD